MARRRSLKTLYAIVEAAAAAFTDRGYEPTTLEEIAGAAGVAVGTIYSYACGKLALLDLTARHCLRDPSVARPALPHPSTTRTVLAERLWTSLMRTARFPILTDAVQHTPPPDIAAEFNTVVNELYRWHSSYGPALELIEATAPDWPEYGVRYHQQFRRNGHRVLTDYLASRQVPGGLTASFDPAVGARLLMEVCRAFAQRRVDEVDPASTHRLDVAGSVLRLLQCGFSP